MRRDRGICGSIVGADAQPVILPRHDERRADLVYNVAGPAGLGILKAAADSNRYAIGVDSDQNGLYPKTIVASMLKQIGNSIYDTVDQIRAGKAPFGTLEVYGSKNDGVALVYNDVLMPASVKAKVDAALALVCAVLATVGLSLIFSFVAITLAADFILAGLGLNILAADGMLFILEKVYEDPGGLRPATFPDLWRVPAAPLHWLPVIGPAFEQQSLIVLSALAANAALVRTVPARVDVELSGRYTYCRTVVDFAGKSGLAPNCDVAVGVDIPATRRAFMAAVAAFSAHP